MTKKLLLFSFFTMFSSFLIAQTTVFGYIKDARGNIIENADVDLGGTDLRAVSDKIGYFQFVDVQPGTYQVIVSKINFETKIVQVEVGNEKRKDAGVIQLSAGAAATDGGVTILDDTSADDDESSMQPTIGLLNSGRDAFARTAAFELGAYWFRPRGVDNRYNDILFNGIPMSKNDDGRVDFSNWGGLNDVTRYPYEFAENITPSDYTFGNLGGVVYYNTRASSFRKQTSLSYSFTNRSYDHRVMATYSSGLSKKGWAFTFSGSRRWAEEGVIEGTYQDSYAYFAAIEKQFGDKHSINLTAFGAPTYRASNSPNTQEIYDLMGKDYNSYWGWQDGEKRNERIRKTFEPIFQLSHYWKMGKNSKLNTTASYQQGSDKRGRLDWYNASSPSPVYYRRLPSFVYYNANRYDSPFFTEEQLKVLGEQYNAEVEKWKNGTINPQIDWNNLYQQNYNMNDMGKSARYYTVQDVNDDKTINLSSHFDTQLASNWKLNANFNYQKLESDNYRRLDDLLGGNYAENLDDYNFTGSGIGKYNVDDDNIKVYEGDRMEYNYMLYRDSYTGNISTNVTVNRWNVTGSAYLSYSESQRDGKYRHYLYLNNSKGKSDLYNSWDFGLKGRVEYRIDGKNFIVYDGALFSIAPTLNEIFINPRLSNELTPELKSQIINSNDLSFLHRGQILKLRLSGYYTTVSNASEISRYYAEGLATNTGEETISSDVFIAEVLSNVDKEYLGGELGAEIKVTPTLSVNAVASIGQYVYTNNPNVYYTSDKTNASGIQDLGPAYIKNYKVAGTPQQGYSFGIRYNSPKYWWLGVTGNYLAGNYLDFSAMPRTSNFVHYPGSEILYDYATEENVRALLKQQKFDDQFMLNANAGKSFLIGKYRMGISVTVNNILNNRNYVTGGFEQGRNANFDDAFRDAQRPVRTFTPKLWYDRGLSYFTNVYLRF
ncbi:MAG: TonB-dependent receptor [Bergeyella sp.]